MAIGEIVAGDGMVVDAEGNRKRVTGTLLRAADPGSDATWIETEPVRAGNTYLKPESIFGWRTYNLTVEGTHTYVAGGLRVHNDCWLESDTLTSWDIGSDGSFRWIGVNEHGSRVEVSEYRHPTTGSMTAIQRDVSFDGGSGATVTATWRDFDANNNIIGDGSEIEVRFKDDLVSGNQVGDLFGSALGQAIGGNDPFARVAASTVIGTLGENVWESLRNWTGDVSYVQGNPGAQHDFDTHVAAAFSNFNAELLTRLRGQAIGAVSSFLAAELAEELGFNTSEFGGQLFNYVASTGINSVLDVALNNIGANLGVLDGLTGLLFRSPGGGGFSAAGFGTFVGTYLARGVIDAVSSTGAIGGQIGGTLGSILATGLVGAAANTAIIGSVATGIGAILGVTSGAVLGVVLPGVGAFIGTVIGTYLGNRWGGDDNGSASAGALFNPGATTMVNGGDWTNDWNEYGRPTSNVRDALRTTLDNFVGSIGGEIANSQTVSFSLFFEKQRGQQPWTRITVSAGGSFVGDNNAATSWTHESAWLSDTADRYLDFGVVEVMKRLSLADANLYVKRALANTQATTVEQLAGEIKIAEDYSRYLAHKDVIDEIIAQNPDSAFAAGWIITLLRADELGITELHRTDFVGGVADFLRHFNVERFGASLADVAVRIEGTTMVLEISSPGGTTRRIDVANWQSVTNMTQVAGAAVTGTAANELWLAQAGVNSSFTDTTTGGRWTSNDVLIGNSGNDTINGGVGADFVQGGGGNDVLVGGVGDDILNGGVGADSIDGGDGDDLVFFDSEDNPLLVNGGAGYDVATVHGVGNSIAFDLAARGFEEFHGGAGAAQVTAAASTASVVVRGGSGDDNIAGSAFDDELSGGSGGDNIVAGGGADAVFGGAGDDSLFGGAGNDTLSGDSGNDTLSGGSAIVGQYNQLLGGSGTDTVSYASTTTGVYADLRELAGWVRDGTGTLVLTDTYDSIENFVGGSGADTLVGDDATGNALIGNNGTDALYGLGGNDTLSGGSAIAGQYNQLWGGSGNDAASYASTTTGVYADLNVLAGWVRDGTGALVLNDTYNSIEDFIGGSGADSLVGDAGGNRIQGGGAADILYASTGAPDAAVDTFVFRSATESNLTTGYDTIVNFVSGQDQLDFTAFGIISSDVLIASGGGSTAVYANTDGIAGYDLALVVVGNNAVTTSDIRL